MKQWMKKLFAVLCSVCMLCNVPAGASGYFQGSMYFINPDNIDEVNWSQVADTSMMIPGQDYHRYVMPAVMPLSNGSRIQFLGWVYNTPKADASGVHISDKSFGKVFSFQEGDIGVVNVTYHQGGVSSINISIFDVTNYEVVDWVTLEENETESLYVDLSEVEGHTFKTLISHNGAQNLADVRVEVNIEEG